MVRALRLALVASACTTATLSAQAPDLRAEMRAWRDSLAVREDADSLRALRRMALAAADSSGGASRAVWRLALVELRLGEVTGSATMHEAAAQALRGVVEDHPEWSLAWGSYALADLHHARTGGAFGYTLQEMLGRDPAAGHVADFVRSTGADSAEADGLLRLAEWAMDTDDRVVREIAVRAFRGAGTAAMVADPVVAIWRGRLERLAGDKDSALAAIEFAARAHPDDPAVRRMQAILRFVYGHGDGAGPWYHGLERADSATLHAYRLDLDGVVPDSVFARVAATRGAPRAEIMQAFWAAQDADGLPTGPDRLAEHYRRLDFSRRFYVRQSVVTAYRDARRALLRDTLPATALDARGEIMMRHGSPDIRSSIGNSGGPDVERTLGIIGMPPNESWRYTRRGTDTLLFHFYVPWQEEDYVAAESLLDILAATRQFNMFRPASERPLDGDSARVTVKTYGAELVSGVAQELLQSRMSTSSLYTDMLNRGKGGADSLQALERTIGRAALAEPPSYTLGFELELDAAIDILALGSDRRGPLLQVAFAIPGQNLTPRRIRTGVVYPVRMRAAVLDPAGRVVLQVDTTRAFVTGRALLPGQHLLGQLGLRVPPGDYRVRVALEADRRGTLSPSTRVSVPDPAAGQPTLSDLSIGVRSVGIAWRAPTADTAWTQPLHRFSRDERMQLYFEVGGMAADTRYTIDLAIDRRGDDAVGCRADGGMLTLRTEGRASGAIDRVQQEVSLQRLDRGEYTLAVTLTTADGQRTQRCRTFRIE
ncbi:MAG: hypothetical protein KC544_11475 [Gemmatimonadetes bacterium]|nr:hypothetical protein [Gemmatimonadota bacterium]MCB9505190.1 hypothetical protein [Gemmatimonadales bacterium]MCA9763737.1 hypothetical protein [Gemmatimonadota bacterium]MCB9518339.1 hypothetical protein [Gemmatimonadales bacterium]HPF62003.1 hypothetical protein [Gemmatimonadales bacterium]